MDHIHEQAWKDHICSLAAALLGSRRVSARQGRVGEKSEPFEHPARLKRDGRDWREKRDSKFRTLQPSDFLTSFAFLAS